MDVCSPEIGRRSYHQKSLMGCAEKEKKKSRLHQHEKKTSISLAVRTLPITQGKKNMKTCSFCRGYRHVITICPQKAEFAKMANGRESISFS